MLCKKCQSTRIAEVSAKCSDLCAVKIGGHESIDYVPQDMGIGGGDYCAFKFCMNCGVIQGKFPLNKSRLEKGEED